MYTSADLSIIYDPYFTVLEMRENQFEVKSNNTGHCWRVKAKGNYYTLYHKHHVEDASYHWQNLVCSIEDALLDIVKHDEYQLRGRKPLKYKPKSTFFDQILMTYNPEYSVV